MILRAVHRWHTGILLALLLLLLPSFSSAATNKWSVTIRLHEAYSKTDDDADGPDDIYWDVTLGPTVGLGDPQNCNRQDDHEDDKNEIKPEWACTAFVSGADNVNMQIFLVLMDHDGSSEDDEFDINPSPGQLGILMNYTPANSLISIVGVAGRDTPQCAPGRIRLRGFNGDDQAEVVFSVSASLVGAPDGDSDSDGLPDTWEVCGVDGDGDGNADVKLPVLGANRFRKDAFVEIDWMEQAAAPGIAGHTHAPWLPSLVNAWREFDVAWVSNPTVGGVPNKGGIALHVDVGPAYRGYGVDYDGNGTIDFPQPPALPPADGNFDLNGDNIPDIGDLGAFERDRPTPDPTFFVSNSTIAEDSSLDPSVALPVPPAILTGNEFFNQGSDFFNIKQGNFNGARDTSFRYVVFGHSYPGQAVGGPADSSGLAENCGKMTCSDLMVTLGGYARQTVDANLDGAPDADPPPPGPPAPFVAGPRGALPVDGTFAHHTGTFMHELGHTMGLRHGGGDDVNFKPNLLSIMNYAFQMRGIGFDPNNDRVADQLPGVRFDGDQVDDVQRFLYSGWGDRTPVLGLMNEGVTTTPATPFLNENNGVAAAGVTLDALTRYSCPPPTPIPPGTTSPPTRFRRADQSTDWNCSQAPGPFTPQPNATADINNENFSSGALENLSGFDEYNTLRSSGLAFQPSSPGIGLQQQRDMDSNTQRIVEPPQGREVEQSCETPRKLDFEDLVDGTPVKNQYGPTARFLLDDKRTPMIVGPGGRNNIPTESPSQSLINLPREEGVPLVVDFYPPQRTVTLYFGQAGLSNSRREGIRAVLSATDQKGLPMGELSRSIPLPNAGVREFIGATAIWPDELIGRIELRYENASNNVILDEPVLIDDLFVCAKHEDLGLIPLILEPPEFGELSVRLRVNAEYIVKQPAPDGEPDHFAALLQPLPGLPVTIDGAASVTDLVVNRKEGTTVNIVAPDSYGGFDFLYWRHSSGASFGMKTNTVPLTLLSDGTLTAVYRSGRQIGHEPLRPDPIPQDWRGLLELREFRRCVIDCAMSEPPP